MLENNVSDPITDQEIAFAHLVLSGIMTDRRAAEALGLNRDTAAYNKAKSRVSDSMLEHQAAVQEQLLQQQTEEHFNLSRDRVLARLWQIADLAPEMTRNSASSQVKALSLIIAMEGLIPDRRAVSAPNKPAPLVTPPFYVSEWMRNQQTAQAQEEAAPEPPSAPVAADDRSHRTPDPTTEDSSSSRPVVEGPAVPASSLPRVPMADYVAPDTRRPFSIDKNRFGRRR
jgi:hypothetical protein